MFFMECVMSSMLQNRLPPDCEKSPLWPEVVYSRTPSLRSASAEPKICSEVAVLFSRLESDSTPLSAGLGGVFEVPDLSDTE